MRTWWGKQQWVTERVGKHRGKCWGILHVRGKKKKKGYSFDVFDSQRGLNI